MDIHIISNSCEEEKMHDIEDICNKYYNIVFKYLIDLTHNVNLSEELTQETFCIAIKEINKFKGECAVSTWLCVIAKHLYYRKYKEIKKYCSNHNYIHIITITIMYQSIFFYTNT